MRGTRLVLGVIVLATAAVLSLSTDFKAASSASDVNSSVARFTSGAPPTASLQPGSPILLVVCGDDDLHPYLEKELVQQLGSSAGNRAAASPSCSVPDETTGPALLVETTREKFTWTPAYASAVVVARIAYASDGDLKWKDDATVVMGRKDGLSQVRVRGDLALNDTTQGVTSRPAYYRHLSRQIALAVSDTVRKQIND